MAISMFRRTMAPNQTVLKPMVSIKGTKIGRVIIRMATGSMKKPRIMMITCMQITRTIGGRAGWWQIRSALETRR